MKGKKFDNITPILRELHLLPVNERTLKHYNVRGRTLRLNNVGLRRPANGSADSTHKPAIMQGLNWRTKLLQQGL